MLALKVESKLIRKESMKFNGFSKKVGVQCSYLGSTYLLVNITKVLVRENNETRGLQENTGLMGREG